MKKHFEALMGNGIYALAGLFSFILLSRNCPKDIFGEWILFVSLSTFFDLVRFGLTRNAVVRLVAGASNEQYSHKINASGLMVGVYIVGIIVVLFYLLAMVLRGHVGAIYVDFLIWYPLVALSNLLWNNAMSWLQAKSRFKDIIVLRGVNMGSFLIGVGILIYLHELTFLSLVTVYLASNFLSSIFSFIRGWDSFLFLNRIEKGHMKEILSFGKYSVGAMLGSSLLKSADSFIISLSPILGTTGVAIYAIPFKIVEMIELPIRSISMVGYNHFSEAVISGSKERLHGLTARYILIMLGITLPILMFVGLFPDFVLQLLGGKGYVPNFGEMRIMLYLLLVYGFMLTFDRITGVTLEALGKPKMNMYKVLAMLFFNIIGDIVAVFVFKSLIGVVFATVIFVTIGVIFGYFLLPAVVRPTTHEFANQFTTLKSQLWKILLSYRKRV